MSDELVKAIEDPPSSTYSEQILGRATAPCAPLGDRHLGPQHLAVFDGVTA